MIKLQILGIGKCHNEFLSVHVPSVNSIRNKPKAAKQEVTHIMTNYYQQCGIYSEPVRWAIEAAVNRASGLSLVRDQGTLNSIIANLIYKLNGEFGPAGKMLGKTVPSVNKLYPAPKWKVWRTLSWVFIISMIIGGVGGYYFYGL